MIEAATSCEDKLSDEEKIRNSFHSPIIIKSLKQGISETPKSETQNARNIDSQIFGKVEFVSADKSKAVYNFEQMTPPTEGDFCSSISFQPLLPNYGEKEEVLAYVSLSGCVPYLKRETRRRLKRVEQDSVSFF